MLNCSITGAPAALSGFRRAPYMLKLSIKEEAMVRIIDAPLHAGDMGSHHARWENGLPEGQP